MTIEDLMKALAKAQLQSKLGRNTAVVVVEVGSGLEDREVIGATLIEDNDGALFEIHVEAR